MRKNKNVKQRNMLKSKKKEGKLNFSFVYKCDHNCEGINTNNQRLTTEEHNEIVDMYLSYGFADHTLSMLRENSTIASEKLTRKSKKTDIKKYKDAISLHKYEDNEEMFFLLNIPRRRIHNFIYDDR